MTLTRFEFTSRVRPILEIGTGSSVIDEGAGVWDVSLWDSSSSIWNGDEPLWRDVSCDVIDAHIELGRGRITDEFPVGTATLTVDNNSGWADPSIDFEQDSTVGYFSFPGTADNWVEVVDYAAIGITGDMCIVFRFRASTWPPVIENGPFAGVIGQWGLAVSLDAQLVFGVFDSAVSVLMGSDPITPLMDWRWFALVFDANNGAGGHDWKWWYAGNAADPAAWVEFDSRTAAGVVTIDDTSGPMFLGSVLDGGFSGDVSHLSIRSGFGAGLTVGGTTVFEFNGWDLRDSDVDATEITPRVGPNPMIIHGTGVSVMPATWVELLPDLFDSADPLWSELLADLYEWTG